MKVATETDERNGTERIKGRAHLRLIGKPDLPKKGFRIGICESLFSPQEEIKKKESAARLNSDIFQPPGEGQQASITATMETLITCAVFGVVLGYLVGKLNR